MVGFGNTSVLKRGLTFATGLLECLCFAGAVFGWASIVFVLKSEGYFSSLCVNTTGLNGTHVLGEFETKCMLKWCNKCSSYYATCLCLFFQNLVHFFYFCILRLQWTGWAVLACFHSRLLYEQFCHTAQWFPLWPLWNHSCSSLGDVSPKTNYFTKK